MTSPQIMLLLLSGFIAGVACLMAVLLKRASRLEEAFGQRLTYRRFEPDRGSDDAAEGSDGDGGD
jgi:hypothetical protein